MADPEEPCRVLMEGGASPTDVRLSCLQKLGWGADLDRNTHVCPMCGMEIGGADCAKAAGCGPGAFHFLFLRGRVPLSSLCPPHLAVAARLSLGQSNAAVLTPATPSLALKISARRCSPFPNLLTRSPHLGTSRKVWKVVKLSALTSSKGLE